MKADDLGPELLDQIAEPAIERPAYGRSERRFEVEAQFRIVRRKFREPRRLASGVGPRRDVTEKIQVDGSRGFSAEMFNCRARLFHAELGARERPQATGLAHGDRQISCPEPRHRGADDGSCNTEQIQDATIRPRVHLELSWFPSQAKSTPN